MEETQERGYTGTFSYLVHVETKGWRPKSQKFEPERRDFHGKEIKLEDSPAVHVLWILCSVAKRRCSWFNEQILSSQELQFDCKRILI